VSKLRRLVYLIILLLAPKVAMANIILPTLTVSLPIMWILLIVVVFVEALVLRELWPNVQLKIIVKCTALGNFMSTLIGIPAAYYLHYIGISLPMSLLPFDWQQKMMTSLPILGAWSVKMLVDAPKIISVNDLGETYTKFLFLLPMAYYVSYWIEYFFFDIEGMESKQVLAGVRRANRISYLVVLLVVSVGFSIMLNDRYGWLSSIWSKILSKTMWLTLLMP
jgi:hypothetical protein